MARKILIVEDEPGLQKSLSVSLAKSGYEILTASDGEEAVKILKSTKPDLILLDLILPKQNGFDVLIELKKDEAMATIPVVVLTNLESGGDIEKAMSLGARGYLIKADYTLNEIVERINQMLEEYLPEE